MKNVAMIVCGAVVMMMPFLTSAQEQRVWIQRHWVVSPPPERFTGQELSLDLFGSYVNPEENISEIFDTSIRRGDWGGGVGLNYFATRYIGIGGLVNFPVNGGQFVDQAGGNLILRAPLADSVAPYIFGGGGSGFDPEQYWFLDAGVGLELRMTPTFGVFTDAQYQWAEHEFGDKALFRAGFRLVF